MRKLILAVAIAVAALALPGTASASTHDPVLFVHGWSDSSGAFDTMAPRFKLAGWSDSELGRIDYSSQSNAAIAAKISTKVDQMLAANPGKTKVDLVTHSMGGLAARYYVKNLGGAAKVDDFVSLGGPNHGTGIAVLCALFSTQCKEMSPNSSFLKALNSGDETPGSVNYGTWWSSIDGIITPPKSTILSGAVNIQTSPLLHAQLLTDAAVSVQVIAFVW